ncbi:MAG: hypothetical protein DRI46_06810 [Chloroflexi bacterium]|nr:MAG: hypothetical protein DRI46_06810 [Chloroflexota bacterium]
MNTWVFGGDLNTAVKQAAGCGSSTATLSFGGNDGTRTEATEEYDGIAWALGGDLSTAVQDHTGAGTQSAGLSFGGSDGGYTEATEEYNGAAWSAGGDLSQARFALSGAGVQTAALAIAGYGPGIVDTVEEYDGAAWSSATDVLTDRYYLEGCGSVSAALCWGGIETVPDGYSDNTESFNGSSWSIEANLGAVISRQGSGGTKAAALSFGGFNSGSSQVATEEYDDTSWSAGGDLSQARDFIGGAGSQASGISFGGSVSISYAVTEVYTAPVIYVPTPDNYFRFNPEETALPNATTRAAVGLPTLPGTKLLGSLPMSAAAATDWGAAHTSEIGYIFELGTGNLDVSTDTKLIIGAFQFNAANRIQMGFVADGGICVRLVSGSGTTDYKDFYVCGQDTQSGNSMRGPVSFVVDLNHTDTDATGGTFDNTDVDAYGWISNTAKMAGSNSAQWVFIQPHWILDTHKNAANIVKFTGTAGFEELINEILGVSIDTKTGTWVAKLSNSYFIPVAFQIGDTSTATHFDCSGKTVISPEDNTPADPRFRLGLQACRVYIVLRDSAVDYADLSKSAWTWGTAAAFDLNVSNDSTITIAGATFSGMGDFTIGTSVSGAANFALADGYDVISNGADIDGSTLLGTGDLVINSATNGDLSNVTVAGDLRVNIAADTTLDFTNVVVTGDVFNDATGYTLTINSLSGSSLTTTEPGTGDGQVNIVSVYTLTLTGIVTGSEVRIYDNNGSSGHFGDELDGVESLVGTEFEYEHDGTTNDILVQIMEPGYLEVKIELSVDTTDFSRTITQEIDINGA